MSTIVILTGSEVVTQFIREKLQIKVLMNSACPINHDTNQNSAHKTSFELFVFIVQTQH